MLLCCIASCGKRHVQIDSQTRRTIDTTASRQIYVLRAEMDSLCELKTDSMVRVMSDSILDVRRQEIRKLLGK
jgi:hypothetical protein